MIQYQELPEVKSNPAENLVAQFKTYINQHYLLLPVKSNIFAFLHNHNPLTNEKAIGPAGAHRMREFLNTFENQTKLTTNGIDNCLNVLYKILNFAEKCFEYDVLKSKSGETILNFIHLYFEKIPNIRKIIDNYSQDSDGGFYSYKGLREFAGKLKEFRQMYRDQEDSLVLDLDKFGSKLEANTSSTGVKLWIEKEPKENGGHGMKFLDGHKGNNFLLFITNFGFNYIADSEKQAQLVVDNYTAACNSTFA